MTAVAVGAVGPQRAGLGSGILNAARQSGGALGVALPGALLTGARHGEMSLRVPLAIAAIGYAIAVVITCSAIRTR